MSRFFRVVVAMILVVGTACAQEQAAAPSGVTIGSSGEDARPARGPCVEVVIGVDAAPPFNCLNKALKDRVDRIQPPAISAPLSAQSQDIHVGVVNSSAVRQQYGRNFGVSVIPQGLGLGRR